jgi:F-type H+-transporting ATPase subunit delta
MSARSVARRYAGALFDVTRKAGRETQAGEALAEMARLISSHAELDRVLGSPAVPVSVKRTVVVALMDAAKVNSDEVRRTMTLLADRDRLAIIPDLAAVFAARLLEARNVVQAEVSSAVPLTETSRAALADALARATGKSVTMTERVDSTLVGGVVARVGTFVYDGSVSRQLERLRDRLMNA